MSEKAVATTEKKGTAVVVRDYFEKNKAVIMETLPRGFNYSRMVRSVMNAVSTTPIIAQCTPASIFLASVKGMALGLEPNGALGHAYLVPFRDNGTWKAQFMPSYKGMIELAMRTGKVSSIYAHEVCEHDSFEYELGDSKHIHHIPNASDRGNTIGYYAVVKYSDGAADFEYMTMQDVNKVRASSKTADKSYSPWKSWPDEMGKKTAVKRLMKRVPMSVEMAELVKADNHIATGEPQDEITAVMDCEFEEVENGEV
jgi:recombination protein RecT